MLNISAYIVGISVLYWRFLKALSTLQPNHLNLNDVKSCLCWPVTLAIP